MKIALNGTAVDTQAVTLEDLLNETGSTGRVATAVNEAFVPAAQRAACKLADGDRVEILAPMQGG
ncbi:MAG: sulfur carrier protein ThiS [Planktomarina sp.]